MNEILKKWILYAQADLDAAQRLFQSPRPTNWTYLLILWHCHQSIEKMLKMLIIKKGKELLKIHDLPRLAKMSEISLSEQQKQFLEDLNEFYLRSRYPDIIYKSLPQPDKDFTITYLQKTKVFFLWLRKQK
ncbi:HEPN domain-containing protein [Candidatus Parcubacteria bacterium]|nr:HEPN domain-containing protein [Candidatus Parcubacteria bacterium]